MVNFFFGLFFTDFNIFLDIKKIHPGYFFLAIGLRFVPWLTKSLRLYNWIKFRNHNISFFDCVKTAIVAELGAIVSPTMMGGEVFYAGMLYKKGISAGESLSITSVAAVENTTFYILFMPFLFLISPEVKRGIVNIIRKLGLPHHIFIIIIVVIILGIVFFFLKKFRLGEKITIKLRKSIADFKLLYNALIKNGKKYFLLNLLYTSFHWISRYSVIAVLMLGVGTDIHLFKSIVFQWAIFLLMHLVPTPGASGGAEGIFLIFYRHIIPPDILGIIMIGWRFIDYYLLGILSIIILLVEKYLVKK